MGASQFFPPAEERVNYCKEFFELDVPGSVPTWDADSKPARVEDAACAIAYWGLVYAMGPNYNKAWRLFDPVDLKHSMKLCHSGCAR